jgi:hypothetical protein
MIITKNRFILNSLLLFSLVTAPVITQGMVPNNTTDAQSTSYANTLPTLHTVVFCVALGAALTFVALRIHKALKAKSSPSVPAIVTFKRVQAQGQKEATCGYHALKNAIALGDEQHRHLLTDYNFTQLHIDKGGVWRQLIIEMAKERNNQIKSNDPAIKYSTDGVDLDEHGIYAIREEALSLLPANASFTVISDVNNIKKGQCRALREKGTHRIVLRVGGGHWIAVVIKRDKKQALYEWADSGNHEHYQELDRLMQAVEIKKP